MTTNQIAYWTLKETERANKARENETKRANLAKEALTARQNDINYQIGTGNLAESVRANQAKETELNRHQVKTESQKDVDQAIEQAKTAILQQNADTNSYNALINARNAATNAGMLTETTRTNMANEKIKQSNVDELSRHNKRDEEIRNFIGATSLSVNANQANTAARNVDVNQQNADTRVAEYNETRRKNLVDQYLRSLNLQWDIERDTAQLQSNNINNALRNSADILRIGQSKTRR